MSLGFRALCPQNSVSSRESMVIRVAVIIISSMESDVVCVVVRVGVVILQV